MRQPIVTLAALCAMLAACLSAFAELPAWKAALAPPDDAWKQTEQHFIYNNGAEPKSLDPTIITGVPEARIAEALFEGLTTHDPVTLQPRPGVATHWDISDDGLTYTFHLRNDARWSDGRPVTAADFAYAWQRTLTPATGAAYAYQLFPIRNAEAFSTGSIDDFSEVGVEVLNPQTLRVSLATPCHYFLDLVAFHALFPLPRQAIEAHGDRWIRPEHIVTNGPFLLESWQPRRAIEMIKSFHYWDRDYVKLERVTVYPYNDLDTAYRLFLQGEIHYMDGVPLGKIDEIRRNPDFLVAPYFGTYFYRFNVTVPALRDVRVRKALAMAVDRSIITDSILGTGEQPVGSFCPPVAGYEPVEGLSYDLETARKLFAEAGYGPDGRDFPTLEILYNTSDAHKKIAQSIAQQWKRNLGVTVSLRNTEWKVYLDDQKNMNYQICRAAWIGDYLDPNTFMDMFVTGGGNNRSGWSNARYDELLRQAAQESDPQKRFAIFQEMERILVVEEVPIMPIYRYVCKSMVSESLMGWYPNIRDHHPLQYVWLEE